MTHLRFHLYEAIRSFITEGESTIIKSKSTLYWVMVSHFCGNYLPSTDQNGGPLRSLVISLHLLTSLWIPKNRYIPSPVNYSPFSRMSSVFIHILLWLYSCRSIHSFSTCKFYMHYSTLQYTSSSDLAIIN